MNPPSLMLPSLIGLPLWSIGRASSVVWFQFGDRRTVPAWGGGTKEVGSFALHTESVWHFLDASGGLVASDKSDRHELRAALPQPLICIAADANQRGTLVLSFDGGARLQIEAHEADGEEYWRLFAPATEAPHLVASSNGLSHA